jgi:hypothetical protein
MEINQARLQNFQNNRKPNDKLKSTIQKPGYAIEE